MWELDHKEGWALKNWCYQIAVLENILESPLDCREIKPINPKGNQMPEYSLEVLMLKFHYFGHLMWRTDSLEKALILGKNEGRRRRGWQRMRQLDGTTNSMEMSLSKLWETVKVREDWHAAVHRVAESNQLSDWTNTFNVTSPSSSPLTLPDERLCWPILMYKIPVIVSIRAWALEKDIQYLLPGK